MMMSFLSKRRNRNLCVTIENTMENTLGELLTVPYSYGYIPLKPRDHYGELSITLTSNTYTIVIHNGLTQYINTFSNTSHCTNEFLVSHFSRIQKANLAVCPGFIPTDVAISFNSSADLVRKNVRSSHPRSMSFC